MEIENGKSRTILIIILLLMAFLVLVGWDTQESRVDNNQVEMLM